MLKEKDLQNEWLLIDAQGQTLGRLATKIATILRGKHKPTYTPHMHCGDTVVVINANQIKVTGNKAESKIYYRHTGFVGGLKETSYKEAIAKDATFPLRKAVERMLNKSSLRKIMMGNLYIYESGEHKHMGQQPRKIEV
jgi:large subunit ribosomal protein L13